MKPVSLFRTVIGGKPYDKGNHVWINNRCIFIEFDSDYYITKKFTAKNWFKKALKTAEKIPNPVTVQWFIQNNWNVSKEIKKIVGIN